MGGVKKQGTAAGANPRSLYTWPMWKYLVWLLGWPLGLAGQPVSVWEPPAFAADAYATAAPEVVPGSGDTFFYLQDLFKLRDRRWSGTWLVQLRPRPPRVFGQASEGLDLVSQTPVDAPHAQRPTHLRLLRLASSLAVVGRLPDPQFDGPRAVVQFFDLKGQPMGPLQTLSCYYNESAAGWWDTLLVAAGGERLVWWGENRQDLPARRRTFVSVFADGGRLQWQHEVRWPRTDHTVGSLTVDRHNTLYLLLDPVGSTSRHRLLAYEPRQKVFSSSDLHWPAPVAWQAALTLDARGLPVVGAVLGHAVDAGLRNGTEGWVSWSLFRWVAAPGGVRLLDSLTVPLADSLRERYCRGSRFRLDGFRIAGEVLLWSWSEPQGDLLTLAFDLEERGPQLRWSAALFRRGGQLLAHETLPAACLRLYTEATDPAGSFRLWRIDRATGRSRRQLVQPAGVPGFGLAGGAALTESRAWILPLAGRAGTAGYRLLHYPLPNP